MFRFFLSIFFGVNILGWPQQDPVRVSSFFGKKLGVRKFVSRLMPLSIIFLVIFLDTKKILNKLLIVLFVIILATVFISGERTALFYFILSTVISIILVAKVRIFYLSSIIILISFAIITINLKLLNQE